MVQGILGRMPCKALQQAGYVPVTFDNLVTGWQDAVKFGPFERGDLQNRSDIDRVFEKYAPIAVMHFAALSQVGESMQKPGLYWQNNVMGSLNLIQSATDHGCMDFVFSSTCATYGDQDNVVLDESSKIKQLRSISFGRPTSLTSRYWVGAGSISVLSWMITAVTSSLGSSARTCVRRM